MIASVIPLLVALGNLEGIDPNTLHCDPAGLKSLLLPHYTDCNKFYECFRGKEVEFTCPSVTLFDFPTQKCTWPWAARCYLRKKKDEEFEGSGEEDINPIMGELPVRPPAMETLMSGRLTCQSLDSAHRRVGYKGDCHRYWRCAGGSPRVFYCSNGLLFNERTQQCDHEANVNCSDDAVDELRTEFMNTNNSSASPLERTVAYFTFYLNGARSVFTNFTVLEP